METDKYRNYSTHIHEFKSYYVVWKQICDTKNDYEQISLNRTM